MKLKLTLTTREQEQAEDRAYMRSLTPAERLDRANLGIGGSNLGIDSTRVVLAIRRHSVAPGLPTNWADFASIVD